jgi:hypothetical protein
MHVGILRYFYAHFNQAIVFIFIIIININYGKKKKNINRVKINSSLSKVPIKKNDKYF